MVVQEYKYVVAYVVEDGMLESRREPGSVTAISLIAALKGLLNDRENVNSLLVEGLDGKIRYVSPHAREFNELGELVRGIEDGTGGLLVQVNPSVVSKLPRVDINYGKKWEPRYEITPDGWFPVSPHD